MLTSILRYPSHKAEHILVVWDTQTGVVVNEFDPLDVGTVMFHGDQRTITLISSQSIYTYDALDGVQLGKASLPLYSNFGIHWIHENTLQFAINHNSGGKPVIDIYKLQPTNPPQILSSFPLPHKVAGFSLSPASLHISFISQEEVIVYDVQDSKPLLQTKVKSQSPSHLQPGQFSADGQFFMCSSSGEVCVWKSIPNSYVPWCRLQPRFQFCGLLWSPTSIPILCWGEDGIQLLHPDNGPNHLLPNEVDSLPPQNEHLVAYSADRSHIATARKYCDIITVFDCTSGTSQQFTNRDMKILDIKVVDNTVFAVDKYKLVGWALEPDGNTRGSNSTGRATIVETLDIGIDPHHLTLSQDCSQIASVKGRGVFLYDVKTQETVCKHVAKFTPAIRFSNDGTQLWSTLSSDYYFVGLEMTEGWNSATDIMKGLENKDYQNSAKDTRTDQESREVAIEGDKGGEEVVKDLEEEGEIMGDLEHGGAVFGHFSPNGYCVGEDLGWVIDSRGRRLLWLPPSWRAKIKADTRWDGNFLALLGGHNPLPIIIEFRP